LENYTTFITDSTNKDARKRGGSEITIPYSEWKNANGMRVFLESTGVDNWKRWEKIVSNYQKNNAEQLHNLCPKFATTFPGIIKEKIDSKNETQKQFDKSVENAIEKFENNELETTTTSTTNSPEVSQIISLLSSGATDIISPGGWQVKVQS
jgi:hypothetical protein